MRTTSLLLAAALGGLVLLAAPASLSLGARAPAAGDDSPLHDIMEQMKDHLKGLARGLGDATKDQATLEHVAAMQQIALDAKLLPPSNLDEIAEDQRAAHATAYRVDMAKLLHELLALEIDLLEGRRQEAGARVKGSLSEMRKAGHKKYQPEGEEDEEDEEDGGRR